MSVVARLTWLPVVVLCAPLAAAQPAAAPLALVTTYADGRVTESVVGPSGFRAWTPLYPRVADWHDAPGTLPVTALNLVAKAEGETLRVWVSVLRGAARELNDPIAEVVVGLDAPVVVADLWRVGLQPVTFSATRFAAPALHVPRLHSRVTGLSLESIEPVIEPTPGYLITVRNRTDVPVVTVAFDTLAGGRRALSGQQGDPSAVPIVSPGATFTFRLGTVSAPPSGRSYATAMPLDDVILSGAIWADGRLGGDVSRVGPLLALHRGRMAALRPIVDILRASRAEGDARAALDRARSAIAAVPIAADAMAVATVMQLVPGMSPYAADGVGPAVSIGSQNVRQRLLADLDRVRPQMTAAAARQWLDEALPACEAWLARLQALVPERP